MLISFLFIENGPENSVILYNDTTAISKPGQTLPFDCTEKKQQMENGLCNFAFLVSAARLARKADWPTLGTAAPAADSVRPPGQCPLGSLACSYLS